MQKQIVALSNSEKKKKKEMSFISKREYVCSTQSKTHGVQRMFVLYAGNKSITDLTLYVDEDSTFCLKDWSMWRNNYLISENFHKI